MNVIASRAMKPGRHPGNRPEILLVAQPSVGDDEKDALASVIADGWITMGERVHAFEQAFAQEHRVHDAVAVSSCTAGLHLVLDAMGIGSGDEVLVPSLTFVATANSVIYTGATPVFVDIESLQNPHISAVDAASKCTEKTKAVIVMHYGGYVTDRATWRDFAKARGLLLIEDSAHAVGAARGEIFGDAAVFSFFGNKNMTTAEGGMIVASDGEMLDKIRQARGHGMTSTTLQRLRGRSITYDVTMLGYNYRMDDLRAGIGIVQLKKLGMWNERRRAITEIYRKLLASRCHEVSVPFPGSSDSAHHILPIILPSGVNRQEIADRMRDLGVHTTVHYPPVHEFSWYRDRFSHEGLSKTEEFASRELTLPLHPALEIEQVEWIVGALATSIGQ